MGKEGVAVRKTNTLNKRGHMNVGVTATNVFSPSVSVVMSCYNASRWLEEAIESVLKQTYGNFELIIIDDGATDGTAEILKVYAARDKRIRIITKPNTGLADSLNVGIDQAKGEWIARLDADDICLPDRLEKQVEFISKHTDVILLGCGCFETDANGKTIKGHRYPERHGSLVHNIETANRFFIHSSAFYKRGVVRQVGGYNVLFKRAQDKDLWLRLSQVGKIACLPDILVKLRRHETSISYNKPDIFGIAATVCYSLRKMGFQDPSSCGGQNWDSFIGWLTVETEKTSISDAAKLWQDLRGTWYAADVKGILCNVSRLTAKLAGSGQILGFLKQRICGQCLGFELAKEWARRNKV